MSRDGRSSRLQHNPQWPFRCPDETQPLDQALRIEIGEEPFFDTLWEFNQANLHQGVEIETLQAIAEEMSGIDIDSFFTARVGDRVVPDLPSADS